MGQFCSRRSSRAHEPLVATDRVVGRGSLPVSCRYTTARPLESDYSISSQVLGEGMSGPVRLAVGRADGQKYAVKSFKKRGMSEGTLQELRNEVEIYLSLDHPHVARLEMVYETAEHLHLVMEYLAGGELYDRLKASKQYTEEAAADAAHQILLAVAYLHAHGIAHRDLKLENFLYVSKDSSHLKIIDFGFAKFVEPNAKMTQSCGSLSYVAPEVLAHAYTEKADMWSFGVIVYMMLVGSAPFVGDDDEVLQSIQRGSIKFSSRYHKLSCRAKEFVQALFLLDPDKRLSAQEALEHHWIKKNHRTEDVPMDRSTLESLLRFAHSSQFRRSMLSTMTWSLSTEDREMLRKQFLALDKDKSGTIELSELTKALYSSFKIGGVEAQELFKSLDTDNNNEIEYTEFTAAALLGHVEVHSPLLHKTFVRFDRDGDGQLDFEELTRVLGDTCSEREVGELLREADTSGDGKLSYDEFLSYFHKSSALVRRSPGATSTCCSKSMQESAQAMLVPRARNGRLPTLLNRAGFTSTW